MKIESFKMNDGEDNVIIFGENGLPLFYENLFATIKYRNASYPVSTIKKIIENLRLFKRIVSLCALNLIERVKSGKAFSKEELDLIYKFSNYHAKDIGVLEKKKDRVLLKTNVLELSRAKIVHKEGYVSDRTVYTRLTVFSEYISWLGDYFLNDDFFSSAKYLKNKRPRRSFDCDEGVKEKYKSLTQVQVNRIYTVIHPNSSENPWINNPSLRARNFLIFKVLESIGSRPGELLKIRVGLGDENDIHRDPDSDRYYISLRASEDKNDKRGNPPQGKTLGRKVPITMTLRELINDYIIKHRSSAHKADKNPYLFITHHGRNTPCRALSLSQVNKLFRQVSKVVGFHIEPYSYRHTWNDRFSAMADKWIKEGKATHEKSEADRRKLMGWSQKSRIAQHYSKRYDDQRAMNVGLELQKNISINDTNLNMVFEKVPF